MTDLRTSDRDVSRAIRSWLHEDRHEDVSRVAGAVLDLLEATPQRRSTWWPARRTPSMNKFVTYGLAAAAVVVAVLIGAQLLGSPGGGLGNPPSPSERPTAEPSSSVGAGLAEGPFVVDGPPVAITVSIPAPGWAFNRDFFVLAKGDEQKNMAEAAMLLWAEDPGTAFYVYGDPCQWESTTPDSPVTTVDEIAAALAAQASRNASEPVDVTVGGYAGKSVTLHVPDDINFEEDCDEGQFASWGLVQGEARRRVEPARFQQGPGQIDEIWFLDVDGVTVILDATYRPDTSAELVEELRSIAESATFEATP